MADVVVTQNVVLKITDVEWKLIMKCLAIVAGVKFLTARDEEKDRAATLNKQLLEQRVAVSRSQLSSAESALSSANTVNKFSGIVPKEDGQNDHAGS
jgi:hypothetical protein